MYNVIAYTLMHMHKGKHTHTHTQINTHTYTEGGPPAGVLFYCKQRGKLDRKPQRGGLCSVNLSNCHCVTKTSNKLPYYRQQAQEVRKQWLL